MSQANFLVCYREGHDTSFGQKSFLEKSGAFAFIWLLKFQTIFCFRKLSKKYKKIFWFNWFRGGGQISSPHQNYKEPPNCFFAVSTSTGIDLQIHQRFSKSESDMAFAGTTWHGMPHLLIDLISTETGLSSEITFSKQNKSTTKKDSPQNKLRQASSDWKLTRIKRQLHILRHVAEGYDEMMRRN